MKIDSIELFEIRIPLKHFFETSFGRTTERNILLVHVHDIDGADGWGECTAGEGPFYSEEWTETAWHTLRAFLAPRIIGRFISGAADVFDEMKHVRGHRMAKAAIETACWDLEAKREDKPLWRYLGGTQIEIPCGVSIGIQDDIESLQEKISIELSAGYKRIKIKIKPGWDFRVIELVRARFPDIQLMVDANSAYSLDDVELLRSLDRFDLMMIEQPLAYDDIFDHAALQKQLTTPVCLDESIRTPEDAKHAIEVMACRIINLKLGRVGGYSPAKLVEAICRDHGVPVWCGGMLESGIGRAHNIAMATLSGFTLPGDVSASGRYWDEDIIEPEVTVTEHGTIIPSESAGVGYRVKRKRIDALTVRSEVIGKKHV